MSHAARLAARLQAVLDQFTSDGHAAIDVIDGDKRRTLPVTLETNYVIGYARKVLSEFHGRPIYDSEHAR